MATEYKVLGQSAPANTSVTTLYTVPAGRSAIISTLSVCNVTAAAATFQIYIRPAGAAAATQMALAYDTTIAANSTIGLTLGLTLAATDVISVRSSVANALAFQAHGQENF